jgi:hypothetical protein
MEILFVGLGNEGTSMTEREALRLALEALESGDYWRGVTAIVAIKQALEQPEPEPVECMCGICKLGKREPLEGVVDVRPIGHHSLQLIFRSQTDIAKFKSAHGIGEKK